MEELVKVALGRDIIRWLVQGLRKTIDDIDAAPKEVEAVITLLRNAESVSLLISDKS